MSKVRFMPYFGYWLLGPRPEDRQWFPNYALRLAPDEQQAHNLRASYINETQLDRYWQQQQLDARQYYAGRRLRRQWMATSYGSKQGSAYHEALTSIGKQLEEVVIHVCLTGGSAADWASSRLLPKADGAARLRAGLDALADHYRMPGSGD